MILCENHFLQQKSFQQGQLFLNNLCSNRGIKSVYSILQRNTLLVLHNFKSFSKLRLNKKTLTGQNFHF